MLAGKLDSEISTTLCEGKMIAQSKTNDGVRQIIIGYFLRRMSAKRPNSQNIFFGLYKIETRSKVLKPREVGVGVAERVEATETCRT